MYLLIYTNKTNPEAHIKGQCVITTSEELTTITANVEIINSRIAAGERFIFPVGQGFILHDTPIEYTVQEITDTALQAYIIDNTGFARHFVDGVINCMPEQFVPMPPIE